MVHRHRSSRSSCHAVVNVEKVSAIHFPSAWKDNTSESTPKQFSSTCPGDNTRARQLEVQVGNAIQASTCISWQRVLVVWKHTPMILDMIKQSTRDHDVMAVGDPTYVFPKKKTCSRSAHISHPPPPPAQFCANIFAQQHTRRKFSPASRILYEAGKNIIFHKEQDHHPSLLVTDR